LLQVTSYKLQEVYLRLKLVARTFLRREGKPNSPAIEVNEKTLQKLFNKINNYRDYKAKQEHGNNWKIKAEIFFFHSYISRQPAYPMKLIM
jgi:hypothetical protein